MLKLKICTDNDAFSDTTGWKEDAIYIECARILREAANALEDGRDTGVLKDYNGNHVGGYEFTD